MLMRKERTNVRTQVGFSVSGQWIDTSLKTMCQQTDWLLVLNSVWTGPDVLEIDKTEPNIWVDCKYVNIEGSWGWNRDKIQRWETKGRVRWREMMGELPKWEEDCRCIKLVKTLTQNYDWWEFKNEKTNKQRNTLFMHFSFKLTPHTSKWHIVVCVKWRGNSNVLQYYTRKPVPN